jgi:DNA topoisomerase IA
MNSNEFSIEPGVDDTGLNERLTSKTEFKLNQIEALVEKYEQVISEHIQTLENVYKLVESDPRLNQNDS